MKRHDAMMERAVMELWKWQQPLDGKELACRELVWVWKKLKMFVDIHYQGKSNKLNRKKNSCKTTEHRALPSHRLPRRGCLKLRLSAMSQCEPRVCFTVAFQRCNIAGSCFVRLEWGLESSYSSKTLAAMPTQRMPAQRGVGRRHETVIQNWKLKLFKVNQFLHFFFFSLYKRKKKRRRSARTDASSLLVGDVA